MQDAVETITSVDYPGWEARILFDMDPGSPKDWDQLGRLVTWHRRHCFDQDGEEEFGRPEDFLERAKEEGWVYLRVGMLDHSGISLYVGGGPHYSDSAGWDSGTVGFIYATKESIEKIGTPADAVAACLEGEIEEWDQYVQGQVYGVVVVGPDGEHADSCWGMYGFDYAKEEAERMLDSAIKWERQEAAKVERMMAL